VTESQHRRHIGVLIVAGDEQSEAVLARHRLERELPIALERGEFELFYQP